MHMPRILSDLKKTKQPVIYRLMEVSAPIEDEKKIHGFKGLYAIIEVAFALILMERKKRKK